MKHCITLLLSFLVLACATPYQKSGLSGGFSETQLAENVFRVSFRGNGYSRGERAEDFALLRSAELTLESGYTHFGLVASGSSSETSTYTTPTTSYTTGSAYSSGRNVYGSATTNTYGGQTVFISKPSATNTVVMFRSKPDLQGMVFDAKFVYESLRKKYSSEFGSAK
jgi:hypothetical protein